MSTAKADSTQDERSRKPGLTLIEVLVAVIVVGVLAAVFVPKIIRQKREIAFEQAWNEMIRGQIIMFTGRVRKLLVASPELVNARDRYGLTLLHRAAFSGYTDMAELLLAKGADVNAKDENGWTPLHWAGSKDVPEVLLKGADVNGRESRWTRMHRPTYGGNKNVAEVLLANGADVNANKDKIGGTPLHWAGSKDVAEVLLANGAQVNARDLYGETPLHYAASWGHKDVAEVLLAKGSDVNAKDDKGRTPLALAEEHGHMELVELLKTHGAKESE